MMSNTKYASKEMLYCLRKLFKAKFRIKLSLKDRDISHWFFIADKFPNKKNYKGITPMDWLMECLRRIQITSHKGKS